LVVENSRIYICSIVPCNRAALDLHGGEHARIVADLFKDGAMEIRLKIDFPLAAILKADQDRETSDGLDRPHSDPQA